MICLTAQIYSAKDLMERMTRIREVLSDASSDWTKRVDAVIFITLHLSLRHL